MEGNACWNCRHLVSCNPEVRPNSKCECAKFQPMFKEKINLAPIKTVQIAEILGITDRGVRSYRQHNGPDAVIKRVEAKGVNMQFVCREGKIKFYRLNADTGKPDKK